MLQELSFRWTVDFRRVVGYRCKIMANELVSHIDRVELAAPFAREDGERLAGELKQVSSLDVYARSVVAAHRALLFLGRRDQAKMLGCLMRDGSPAGPFEGQTSVVTSGGQQLKLIVGPANAANAAALRTWLPFLVPQPLGLHKSAGCGDRLGLATPGHIRAFRSTFGVDAGPAMAPIFAQQSIRENARTGRTPQEVIDDAMWGVFQEGWRDGFGADADHLKSTEDVDDCTAAGYTFYTVDPGDHVDDSANQASSHDLRNKVEMLPWDLLEDSAHDLELRLANRPIDLGEFSLTIALEDLLRAAAKYGHAVAHTVHMYRHLAGVMQDRPYEFEMSVDETETITTLAEHVYIASELKRLGIRCVSLAPRYVGRFEKGADYIGDLAVFERSFAQHLAVSQAFGPYKLSLHSGSDKFSIYPIAARVAGELVHLKTAGTSYLEALRAIAAMQPPLFRKIVAFALARYPTDRATYHVSAEADKVPDIAAWPEQRLPALLDDFHAREILHVTFGSVLNHQPFREPFFATLAAHEETYYQMLETHFNRHFAPFATREC